jgi:hypothetical protein
MKTVSLFFSRVFHTHLLVLLLYTAGNVARFLPYFLNKDSQLGHEILECLFQGLFFDERQRFCVSCSHTVNHRTFRELLYILYKGLNGNGTLETGRRIHFSFHRKVEKIWNRRSSTVGPKNANIEKTCEKF